MKIEGSQSGLALIVTLLLGLIAAGFIGAMMYVLSTSTRISGIESRYTAALEASKGGVHYIENRLSNKDLNCTDGNGEKCLCSEIYEGAEGEGSTIRCWNSTSFYKNATVELNEVENLGDYEVSAYLLSKARKVVNDKRVRIYTFEVNAQSTKKTEEKSQIEFVYKLEN